VKERIVINLDDRSIGGVCKAKNFAEQIQKLKEIMNEEKK
jgi:hypothetical protein